MRRRINGYTDIGKPFIPPIPHGVAMTDRGTGTVYLLTESTTDVNGDRRLSITTPLPASYRTNTLDPNAGPYLDIGIGQVRLFIRDGRLGFEDMPLPSRSDQAAIVTRKTGGTTRDAWEIIKVTPDVREDVKRALVYEQKLQNGVGVN